MRSWSSILITGGSSGLGAALAQELAGPGVRLALTGQNQERLAEVAALCTAKGAAVEVSVRDVADKHAMANFVAAMDTAAPLDLVVANAGISAGTGNGAESAEQARRIFAVNVDGVVNTVAPILDAMGARGRGQIAIVSSLAGFRGLPGAPAYCASKAAVRVWGEALRADWGPRGVRVNVVCPGFVTTRMTARNNFRMPLLMSAERAAAIVCDSLARDVGRIAFPRRMYAASWLLAALPGFVIDPLLRRLPRKA
ncbi:MAG: SDR family NAD(P)-dependent oxidoreductase [Magnetospirillum sp.]|nr:SDR family NAD(P)-dependent oxidoreductase [Magnetospirillum sp.]